MGNIPPQFLKHKGQGFQVPKKKNPLDGPVQAVKESKNAKKKEQSSKKAEAIQRMLAAKYKGQKGKMDAEDLKDGGSDEATEKD